jgi:hypothetical protein
VRSNDVEVKDKRVRWDKMQVSPIIEVASRNLRTSLADLYSNDENEHTNRFS